jgi:hypothetical protein
LDNCNPIFAKALVLFAGVAFGLLAHLLLSVNGLGSDFGAPKAESTIIGIGITLTISITIIIINGRVLSRWLAKLTEQWLHIDGVPLSHSFRA